MLASRFDYHYRRVLMNATDLQFPEAMTVEAIRILQEVLTALRREAQDAGAAEYDSWAANLEYDSWSACFRRDLQSGGTKP